MREGSQRTPTTGNFSPLRAGLLGPRRGAGNDPPSPMIEHPRPKPSAGSSGAEPPPWKGLVKIRVAPLVQRRTVELAAVLAGRWREIVEAADVVSEGRTIAEGARRVY